MGQTGFEDPAAPVRPAADPDLARFVDALGEGLYGVDLSGNCLFVNDFALRVLRYERAQDLVGRNMHDLIHHTRSDGSAFPASECPLLRTSRSGRPVQLESETLWRRDGTSFLAEYSSAPVFDADRITGSVITFRENSVRRDAAVRLAVQQSVSQVLAGADAVEAMMLGLLETIGRGFGWQCGAFWSEREPEAAGLVASVCWTLPGQTVWSPGPEAGAALALSAWATGEPVHAALAAGPLAGDRPRGVAFPVGLNGRRCGAIAFLDHRLPEIDDSLLEALRVIGEMIGQGIERRRSAADLRASETRFRVIADTNPQLSWIADPGGRITWFNQRWYDFTGTDFAAMAGWGWLSVHHPDHAGRVEIGLRHSLRSGEEWEDTFPLRAGDGSWRWFLSRAVPIRGEADDRAHGSIVGWFGTNTDITAMRMAEEAQTAALAEAEAASLAKSLFLANMSHELRTPLSAIIGYTEMLAEEIEDGVEPELVLRDLGKVETNARHLLGLINDVLDLSKVESGRMEIYAERFEVAWLVREVAATVATLVERGDNALELLVAPDAGSIECDVTRTRQILLNLLGNAAKFTRSGRITLTVTRAPAPGGVDRIVFEVADTGLGMSAEQLGKLFQRFQQADASTTRRFGGTGLGLSLSRSFAQMLGGDVAVESELGRGSVFTVSLPVSRPVGPAVGAAGTLGAAGTVLVGVLPA